MWLLDYKKSWAPKNWCFWTVVLEKTLESLLDCKRIQPVHPKGNQSWILIWRIDAEAEAPILWSPDVRADTMEKIHILGKIEDKRRSRQQRMKWLNGIMTQWTSVWASSELVMGREYWHASLCGVAKSRTRLSKWTKKDKNRYNQQIKERT